MQDWKMTDEVARVEIDRLENERRSKLYNQYEWQHIPVLN